MKYKIIKSVKVFFISILVLLTLMVVLPMLFPEYITKEVKTFANSKLNSKLDFKEANLSFFNHFPSLTLTLHQFSLKGSKPYENQDLVSANEISFGINLKTLIFDRTVTIDEIYVSDANAHVKVDEEGRANYNVYKSDNEQNKKTDTSSTSLKLSSIEIKNTHIIYDDKSTKMLIDAVGFNYLGKGDLDKAIFDLDTQAKIDDFNFSYDGEIYLKNKKVNANLITQINTNSLNFIFQQNDLKINQLPIDFKGKLDFLANGYDIDFKVQSIKSNLHDLFTALPPKYVTWLEKSKVKGITDLTFEMKGKYIKQENLKPDVFFGMNVRNGELNYNKAKLPANNVYLNFRAKLPSLNTNELVVNLDSLYFNVGKDYFKAKFLSKGLNAPHISTQAKASLNLTNFNNAIGINGLDLAGVLNLDIKANGTYNATVHKMPTLNGTINFQNGKIKTKYYPNPIQNINLIASVNNKTGFLKDGSLYIEKGGFVFEGKPVNVFAKLNNFENINYDIKAKGELDVAKIYKVFSRDGLALKGYIKADVSFKGSQQDAQTGNYKKLQNKGTLLLKNIAINSTYLPKSLIIKNGNFNFNQDKMNFSNFTATYGQSDFLMNGYLQNVIDYALTSNAVLKGNFSLYANYINIDEFMQNASIGSNDAKKQKPSSPTQTGVIVIPKVYDIAIEAKAQNVSFNDLDIKNISGKLLVNQGKLNLKNTNFTVAGAQANMDILYFNQSNTLAHFDYIVKASDFDVKKMYNEVKMFREMASAAKSAEGIISLDYHLSGKLNQNMMPIFPSLEGEGTLSVKQVKMKGFKLFNAVSAKTNKEEIKNPDITKVDIKSKIKNNIITIDRFKFKVAGFRPRIEGQTSLDGKLNLKMRLGLPPFGIIGVPMTITGTQENPKIKLGKQTEDLEETEYNPTPNNVQ